MNSLLNVWGKEHSYNIIHVYDNMAYVLYCMCLVYLDNYFLPALHYILIHMFQSCCTNCL